MRLRLARFATLALALAVAAPARAVVSSATSSSGPYACNGSTTVFTVGFRFLASSDLVVTVTKSPSTMTLALGTDYTVTGAGDQSGTVKLVSGSRCPNGYTLTVKRLVTITQATPFSTQGTFNPKAHELAFDRLTMAAQQVDRRVADAEATHAADKVTQATADAAQDSARVAGDAAERAYLTTALAGMTPTGAEATRITALEAQNAGFTRSGTSELSSAFTTAGPSGAVVVPPNASSSATPGTNSSKVPVLDLRTAIANSFSKYDTIGTPALYLRRRNTSPAVSGAGVINGWYDPAFRFDWESDSGGATGSHGGVFVYSRNVAGKEWTTITQDITASGSPQTVTVADSSIFAVNDTAMVDVGQGSSVTEFPLITGVPDATHITATFTKNHSNGAWVTVSGKGDKIGLTTLMTEGAGNSANLTNLHVNTIATQGGTHSVNGWENDVTSNVAPGAWLGDGGPMVSGFTVTAYGSQDSSFGAKFSTGNGGVSAFKTGLFVHGRDQALWIFNGNAQPAAADVGIRVSSAKSYGLVVGANQALPHPKEINVNPSIAGILLTAKGSAGTWDSNALRLESMAADVPHTFDLAMNSAGGLRLNYDGSWTGVAFDTDGGFSNQVRYRLRRADTNGEIGAWYNSSNLSLLRTDVIAFSGNGTTSTASTGQLRLPSAGGAYFRNNADSGDIKAIFKSTDDVVEVGGAAGVRLAGGLKETWAASASGSCIQGEKVWNTAPTAGGNIGWVCISSGTWKTFGAIAP